MVDAATRTRNADAPWNDFSSDAYWQKNYQSVQPEDREIIHLVSNFFSRVFADRRPAARAIDVGSGANLYPALLMLPWTERILLTDYSAPNIRWLRRNVTNDDAAEGSHKWPWHAFWEEVSGLEGYSHISEPRKQLQVACSRRAGQDGIAQITLFDLPRQQWQLGTMFFVAESITEDHEEFNSAIEAFVGALQPGAPFATAFMAGSTGYPVDGTNFPAIPIDRDIVTERFTRLNVSELSVDPVETRHRVRDGYREMIVATGIVGAGHQGPEH